VSLSVLVDGVAMADEAARAFWQRFSAWMDDHHGDLGGFAKAEGLASVRPEMHRGEPVLIASRSAGQAAYASAANVAGGGKNAGKTANGGAQKSAAKDPRRPRETPPKRRQ
jgi:hypothetical protein